MRNTPFETIGELEAYTGGPQIQCLECGKWFKSLATHIPRIHGMSHDDYRQKWGIPKRFALAGTATREKLSEQLKEAISKGAFTYDHLDSAVEAARTAGRGRKAPIDQKRQSEMVAAIRPGDHSKLPTQAKTADGRDVLKRREYQQAYRAEKNGEKGALKRYRTNQIVKMLQKEFGLPEPHVSKMMRSDLTENEKLFIAKHYPKYGPEPLALTLGRSYRSITNQAHILGAHHKSRQGDSHKFRWDKSIHDKMLIELLENGMTQTEVASVIGTSPTTVSQHAIKLGISNARGKRPK